MTADAPESGTQILPDRRARVRRHVSELFRLAGPIIVARLGVLLIVVTDAVMVGRAHTLELAYLAVGTIPFVPLLLTGLGLLMGTMVLTAEAFGAGDRLKCGEIWRRGMPYGLVLGVAGMAFCALGPAVLLILGQNPELAEGGGRVLQIFGLGLPAIMIFLATNFFLEGIKRPEPAMVLMIVANVLNVGFNWLLIEGQWGFPAWGADGAAVATTAIRYFLAVGLLIYVFWLLPERDTYGLGIKPAGGWRAWARQRELGYATGLAIGIESSAFAAMSVFAGWLGATSVAAYSIAYNVLGILFMIAIGFGGATAVRVGNAYGRRDAPDMVLAGWVGLGTNTVVAVVLGGGLLAFGHEIAGLYTQDPDVLPIAGGLVVLIAFVLLVDGGQSVVASALRGRQDVWVPLAFQSFSYLGVMIPLGWALSVKGGFGVDGLVLAVFLASCVSVTLLSARFHRLSLRPAFAITKATPPPRKTSPAGIGP